MKSVTVLAQLAMNHSITCSIAVLYSYSSTKWQRNVSKLYWLANFVPLTLIAMYTTS